MRINDIARIAGVTTRTVRYYHKIGIITEPERDTNNYRRYDVTHLVRLLRIRRLSALGFALDEVRTLLEGGAEEAKDALGKLDHELEAQIKELARRRETIAQLAASQSMPDVPLELAQFNMHIHAGMTEERQRVNDEHSVLLAHLIATEEMPSLINIYRHLAGAEMRQRMFDIETRYSALGPGSDPAEIEGLIEDYLEGFGALIAEAPDLGPLKSLNEPANAKILRSHTLATTNAQQRYVLEQFVKRFRKVEDKEYGLPHKDRPTPAS